MLLPLLATLAPTADARPPAVCDPAEIRVSAVGSTWFDLHVDGVQRVESRVNDGQQSVWLEPGLHHVRATDFMGRVWSDEQVWLGCNEVLIGEVGEHSGLRVLTRLGAPPPARPAPPPTRRGHHRRPHSPARRPHRPPPPRVCHAGVLNVVPVDNAWFDVVVDGVTVAEVRNFDGVQRIDGLTAGAHHVRIQSFVGDVWSDELVHIDCGQQVYTEVYSNAGLRVL